MKVLIAYSTKSGATKKCAEILAEQFTDCTIADLEKERPSLEDFDTILVGSGIRMGKIYKPVKNFIHSNLSKLLAKRTAIYFCNAYPEKLQKAIEKNIPEELRISSLCIRSLGGSAPFSPANDSSKTWVNQNDMRDFVSRILSPTKQ